MPQISLTLPEIIAEDTFAATPDGGSLRVPGKRIPGRTLTLDADIPRRLLEAARGAAGACYAPFSEFPVGAAVVMADDPARDVITGANVENSSFGLTVCAERNAISRAAALGFRRIAYLAVTTRETLDGPLSDRSPCGACRQVIREFADERTLIFVDTAEAGVIADVFDIDRLLPSGFRFS
jgi:cytidine deaminase